MTDSINCGYARVAARHFTTKQRTKNFSKVMLDFNAHFRPAPTFEVTYNTAVKIFPAIVKHFNMK